MVEGKDEIVVGNVRIVLIGVDKQRGRARIGIDAPDDVKIQPIKVKDKT